MQIIKLNSQAKSGAVVTVATFELNTELLTTEAFNRAVQLSVQSFHGVLDDVQVLTLYKDDALDSGADRAELVDKSLAAYEFIVGSETDADDRSHTRLACVLADMRHWCLKHGVDFDAAVDYSNTHFTEELEEIAANGRDRLNSGASHAVKLDNALPTTRVSALEAAPDALSGGEGNRLLDAVDELLGKLDSWGTFHESHLSPIRDAMAQIDASAPETRGVAVASLVLAVQEFLSKAEVQRWAIHGSHLAGVRAFMPDQVKSSADLTP